MIDPKTLRLITQNGLQAFAIGRTLDGIAALRTLMPYCATETIIHAEAENLEENYHHMLSFLRHGGDDQKRSEVQAKIQKRGIALLEQANRTIRISLNSDQYSKAWTSLKENYKPSPTEGASGGISDRVLEAYKSSPLTGDLEGARQDDLFDLLWTSPLWTAQDTAFWYDFFLGQQDMVQQHLAGAIFLSAWEYHDAEKIQLLNFLADSECHRTHISAVTYLLLLRLRHRELIALTPPLPDNLRSRKGRQLIAQVQYEMLLMLLSEKDLKKEMDEMGVLSKNLLSGEQTLNMDNVKALMETKERYLKNRLQRGLDPNLTKAVLLHHCKYMHRIAHWFLPFDKNHPLFQSVMIDEKGREKQNLSTLVDLILDCDVDKLATLYLVSNDKDFSKAVRQLDDQEIPDFENAVIPEYTFRFIMQDLYRFFMHSPVSPQLVNPFREKQTLLDFPELAVLFSPADYLQCCRLLLEIGREEQALTAVDDFISREGATAETLQVKGEVLMQMKRYTEAQGCLRSAEILQPDNPDILRLLVECYGAQHRYEDELEYLQRLAELFPDDKTYRRLIPTTLVKTGRSEEALQLFFKLDYEAQEDEIIIISSIAETAFNVGKLDISERYTEKEMQLTDGKNWFSHLRMGHIHLLRGNWKNSLDSYEQFINTFCKGTGKDIKTALTLFNKEQEPLTAKGISREDFLLIHDILQSASDGTIRT